MIKPFYLIADDVPANSALILAVIEAQGQVAVACPTIDDALNKIASEAAHIAACVVDYDFKDPKGRTGLDIIVALRRAGSGCPIVLASSHADTLPKDWKSWLAEHNVVTTGKPYNMPVILAAMPPLQGLGSSRTLNSAMSSAGPARGQMLSQLEHAAFRL